MASDEDKIYGAFTECPFASLQCVPTYNYMPELNVYLKSCSLSVPCVLGCGTLGYLVFTAQPSIFTTHCATAFVRPVNPGIYPSIPTPAPSTAALSIIVREHKNEVRVFTECNAVD